MARTRLFLARSALGVLIAAAVAWIAAAPAHGQAGAAAAPAEDRKARAKEHFDRGVELSSKGSVEAALAEFLESRRLFPTRSATYNAASCLRSLERTVEALETYEALLG